MYDVIGHDVADRRRMPLLRRHCLFSVRGWARVSPLRFCHGVAATTPATSRRRLFGVVDSWHFVDRSGRILVQPDTNDGSTPPKFALIKGTKHFDTLMPTMHRDLKGTRASFVLSPDGEYAENIVLEIDTAPTPRYDPHATVRPVIGRQDIRQESIHIKPYAEQQREEQERKERYLRERSQGSVTIDGTMARVVCPDVMHGRITHWSALHRTGMIEVLCGKDLPPLHYVIQRAQDFIDAMPSSLGLVGSLVEFRPVHTHVVANPAAVEDALRRGNLTEGLVQLGECTHMVAEDIIVREFPKPCAESTTDRNEEDASRSLQRRDLRGEEEDLLLEGAGPHFGIVTRWSGGQGTLEAGNGKVYFMENANAFATFDPGQAAIRGAVVQFEQDRSRPKFAVNVVILSEMSGKSGGVSEPRVAPTTLNLSSIDVNKNVNGGFADVDYSAIDISLADKEKTTTARNDDPYAHLPERRGRIVTYSKSEKTGVIDELDDNGQPTNSRFVIRDASRDVVGFSNSAVSGNLAKGCVVSFVATGASGKVAVRVVLQVSSKGENMNALLASTAEGTKDSEGEGGTPNEEVTERKSTEEAVASPTAMGYWLQRFERVGANMTEYRKASESLKPPDPNDEPDFADDPWFNDPKRNRVLRGGAKVSDMMKLQPAGLMHLGMQAQDPVKLNKEIKKYEKKLPDDVRAKCLEEAKALGPKFLKNMQANRERNGQSTFNFFK